MTNSASHKLGSFEIFSLSDGSAEFGSELFSGAESSEINELLVNANKSKIETNFNSLLIRDESGNTLIDTGMRGLSGPETGHLPAALAEIGIAESDIDRLVLTHLHPDHIAGAVTPDGSAVFDAAEVFITSDEIVFWSNLDNFPNEEARKFQQLAASVLNAYDGKIKSVDKDAEISSGISLMDLPGHTPGHVGILIDSGDESFIFATDIFHAQDLQLANPEIAIAYDVDKELAVRTRKRFFDMVASDATYFTAGHILGAEVGQLERYGTGYAFVASS
ncbi:MAG: MBL fold metallo-hydrolase [Albidovulum sp.]|nr:MBL fold metallo-hydrolase [Albidovulum sp.]